MHSNKRYGNAPPVLRNTDMPSFYAYYNQTVVSMYIQNENANRNTIRTTTNLANCHTDVPAVYLSKRSCKQNACQCPLSLHSSFHGPPTEHIIQRYNFFTLRSGTIRDTVACGNDSRCTDTKGCYFCVYMTLVQFQSHLTPSFIIRHFDTCMTCLTDTIHLQNASSHNCGGVGTARRGAFRRSCY